MNQSNLRILRHVAIGLMVLSGAALAAPDPGGDSDSDSGGPKTKTVKVKCNEGQSIAKALLENKADFLIVEIKGFCEEKITINRSGVTLRGSDPEKDGLMGPADPVEEPLVTVTGANTVLRAAPGFQDFSVTIENLGFVGNDASALLVWDSLIRAANVRFTDNTGSGVHLTGASAMQITDALMARNGIHGALANRVSSLSCERCTFEENGTGLTAVSGGTASAFDSTFTDNGFATRSSGGGALLVFQSTVSGPNGFRGDDDGRLTVASSPVSVSGRAFWFNGGQLRCFDTDYEGAIRANRRKSHLHFVRCNQTASSISNFFDDDATLRLDDSTLVGLTDLHGFSSGTVRGSSSLGDLTCDSGADLWCDGDETKLSSTCGQCP